MIKLLRSNSFYGLLAGLILLLNGSTAGLAWAMTTIVVNDTGSTVADDGQCTLPEAIVAANLDTASGVQAGECPAGSGADVIQLEAGQLYSLTTVDNQLDGPNGLPSISSAITLEGNGATLERSTLSTTPEFRLLHIGPAGDLTLRNITLQNGRLTVADATVKNGGGVYNQGGLTIVNSTVFNNQVRGGAGSAGDETGGGGGGGGGGGLGGGLFNAGGTVSITNSTFSANRAIGGSGGLGRPVAGDLSGNGGHGGGPGGSGGVPGFPGAPGDFSGGGGGGSGSTGAGGGGGASGFGGGGGGGGATTNGGPGSNGGSGNLGGNGGRANSVTGGGGGGGAGLGGGLFNNEGIVTLLNTTFADNSASGGLGGRAEVPAAAGQPGQGLGGALFNRAGNLTVQNSILASSGGACHTLASNTLISLGFNLIDDNSCASSFNASGDQTNQPALLGPLQNNGGPTPTHALLSGSPALEAITTPANCTLSRDQRGQPRPQGQFCDSGAYEAPVAAATLILTKIVEGTPPGTGWQFNLNAAPLTPFGPAGGTQQLQLQAGNYTLTELTKPGYAATAACDNGVSGESSVSLTLAPAETVTCTFRNSNTRLPNSLTLINETVPGGASGFAFAGNFGDFSLDDGQSLTQTDLPAGSYRVSELKAALPDPFWALVYVACEMQSSGETRLVYPPVTETETEFVVELPLAEDESGVCVFHNERVNFNGDGDEGLTTVYLPFVVR